MRELKEEQLKSLYNDEPVYYCKSCLSLYIEILDEDDSLCRECNRTDIGQTDIFTWRDMWKEKYGEYPEDKYK